jgi:23S rRNA (adenine2503-C2)-methyltransferase
MTALALQAVTPAQLAGAVAGLSLAEARKAIAQVHRGETLAPSSRLRRASVEAILAAGGAVPELAVLAVERSAVDPFAKLLLGTADGHRIEAVRIPLERAGRYTVCVSSQVGCALACAFCATGRLGLSRNLEAWEIIEQVRAVARTLAGDPAVPDGARVHGVVFQGMGEPMANLDRVLEAIAVMTEPAALAIDARNITVCTSGLPHGIRRLAREAPHVRLGVSLGAVRAAVRRSIMPIEGAHSLEDVLVAVAEHATTTGLAPMWAVTLLAGVNDSVDDARALADRAHAFTAATGVRPRLSLIPYNPIALEDDPFQRSDDQRERAFRDVLVAAGLPHHKRYSGGGDVAAACGQLAARAG